MIKKHNILAAVLFCGFLFAMALGYLLLPKTDFSEMEKRYLAEPPKFTWNTGSTGKWGGEVEEYLADHIPGRNFFVGVNAYLELWAGRQGLKDVWLVEGKLVEAPVALNEATVERNMKTINSFAQKVGQDVHVMVVPSAGWAVGDAAYTDEDTLDAIYAAAGELVRPVAVEDVYRGNPQLYYNTDHHWTSQGAYLGYSAFVSSVGKTPRAQEDFTVTVAENFQGSTYSRSALWLTKAETIELWQGAEGITVTNGETEGVHQGLFYPERLETADKYTVFLDGNHSIVRVHNPNGQGKVLVVRDSYSNCLGCFLAQTYEEVVLIDLRYYRQSVSNLVLEEGFDDILVCYSCANFLTDTNLMLLR